MCKLSTADMSPEQHGTLPLPGGGAPPNVDTKFGAGLKAVGKNIASNMTRNVTGQESWPWQREPELSTPPFIKPYPSPKKPGY